MLNTLLFRLRLLWRLLRDPRIEFYKKLIPLLGIVYIISPLDFIPDVFLVIGQIDDVGLILLGMRLFELSIPADILAEHVAVLKGEKEDEGYKIPIRDYKVVSKSEEKQKGR